MNIHLCAYIGPLVEPLGVVDVEVDAPVREPEAGAPLVVPVGAVERDAAYDVLHPWDVGDVPAFAAGRAGHGLVSIFAVDRERPGGCVEPIPAGRDQRM